MGLLFDFYKVCKRSEDTTFKHLLILDIYLLEKTYCVYKVYHFSFPKPLRDHGSQYLFDTQSIFHLGSSGRLNT